MTDSQGPFSESAPTREEAIEAAEKLAKNALGVDELPPHTVELTPNGDEPDPSDATTWTATITITLADN